jgi:hypothetical protein
MMAYQGTGTFIDKTPGSTSRYTGLPKGERIESETDVPTKIKNLLKEKPNGLTIEEPDHYRKISECPAHLRAA